MLAALMRLMDDGKSSRKVRGPEDALAKDIAAMLRAATLEGRLIAAWTCVSNEVGAMSLRDKGFNLAKARYATAKSHGLITGSADYVFTWAEGGGWIEAKSKTGSLSSAQRDFRDWVISTGSRHAVCRSVKEVEQKLFEWGVLRPGRSCE